MCSVQPRAKAVKGRKAGAVNADRIDHPGTVRAIIFGGAVNRIGGHYQVVRCAVARRGIGETKKRREASARGVEGIEGAVVHDAAGSCVPVQKAVRPDDGQRNPAPSGWLVNACCIWMPWAQPGRLIPSNNPIAADMRMLFSLILSKLWLITVLW